MSLLDMIFGDVRKKLTQLLHAKEDAVVRRQEAANHLHEVNEEALEEKKKEKEAADELWLCMKKMTQHLNSKNGG